MFRSVHCPCGAFHRQWSTLARCAFKGQKIDIKGDGGYGYISLCVMWSLSRKKPPKPILRLSNDRDALIKAWIKDNVEGCVVGCEGPSNHFGFRLRRGYESVNCTDISIPEIEAA